mgnify:FL=1|jgi:hypothetical protein|tara:strand:- start:125 stop:505 length:381 start_codon:yes stop_codon:yes gene_type:complete
MVRDSYQWKLSEDKIFEIIHLTLIDILSERKDKTYPLNKLVELLNSRTKIYRLHDIKKYNSFSKYLKIEERGILNFIEKFNFYSVIRTDRNVYVQLYKYLVDLSHLSSSAKRITKDSEWILIDDSD